MGKLSLGTWLDRSTAERLAPWPVAAEIDLIALEPQHVRGVVQVQTTRPEAEFKSRTSQLETIVFMHELHEYESFALQLLEVIK